MQASATQQTKAPLLASREISFSYGAQSVVQALTLNLMPGTVTGILGPNGAGKSTLIRLLAGLLPPKRGEVLLGGEDISSMSESKRARSIALVPQESHIPFPFTALEIVLMGRAPYHSHFGFDSQEDIALAHNALTAMDCSPFAARDISALSGGERRRVIIARALAQKAQVLLLDEPTSFLDIRHAANIAELLRDLAHAQGIAVCAVIHDISLAAAFCDQIVLLKEGRNVGLGAPREILTAAKLHETFGIRVITGIDPDSQAFYCIPRQESR